MKMNSKILLGFFVGVLSLIIGLFLAFISIKAYVYREALFQANSEFPITEAYFYKTFALTLAASLILILLPIYFYFKKRK